MLVKCTCRSEFQDKVNGVNMRSVTPRGSPPSSAKSYRCTVCGVEHRVAEDFKKAKK